MSWLIPPRRPLDDLDVSQVTGYWASPFYAAPFFRPLSRLRSASVLLAAATTIVALLLFSASVPAESTLFAPTPPPGWHITTVTEPAWTQLFDLRDGVLVASNRPTGIQSPDAVYDSYRLGDGGEPTTALRGFVRDLGSGVITKLPVPPDLHLNPNGSPAIDDGRVVWSAFGLQH